MSNEVLDNPIFASKYIAKFTHYQDIDEELRENIEMDTYKDISYILLPIVDQVPENKKGIVRVFITNNSTQPITLTVRYSIVGWFSDLKKDEKTNLLETITIQPKEVWFRDVAFRSSIKQGKNYFQLILKQKKEVYATTNIEYSQIREIEDEKQIERSNFLGMQSKAYINPKSINYWIFFSIFGSGVYKKESIVFLILKLFGVLSGAILTIISIPSITLFPDFMLPISIIILVIFLLSFITNIDDKKVKFISKLNLTDNPKKGSLAIALKTSDLVLPKFCISDINFLYDSEKKSVHWKEGSNKLYERLVPIIGNIIGISTEIKSARPVKIPKVEEIKDKEELKKKIEAGIQLQHVEGIRFKDEIVAVGEGSESVEIDVGKIDTQSSITPDVDTIETDQTIKQDITPIETKPDIKQDIQPIHTEPKIQQEIQPLESDTTIEAEIQPIKTKTKGILEDARGYIGEPTDVETIPIPKDIPSSALGSPDKKSVKELKKKDIDEQ